MAFPAGGGFAEGTSSGGGFDEESPLLPTFGVETTESSPQEAAENINGADSFDTSPESFKTSKEIYTVAMNEAQDNERTHPIADEFKNQSTEHATLVNEEKDLFYDLFETIDVVGDMLNGKSRHSDIAKLN